MNATSRQEEIHRLTGEFDTALQAVEDKVYTQPHSLEDVLLVLDRLRIQSETAPFVNLLSLNLVSTEALCTRIAALYFKVLTDFNHKFDLRALQYLCIQKRFITHVFEASGYQNLDALVGLLQRKAQALAQKKQTAYLANQGRLRALAITPMADLSTEDLVNLSLEEGELVALLAIGFLLDRTPLSLTGEANRKFLLEEFNPYEQLGSNPLYRHLAANVWMLCSYSAADHKHTVKKHLNAWFERYLKSKHVAPKKVGETGDAKPTLVMVAESFKSGHAMFRWYGPLIKRMQQDYRMVLTGLPEDVDEQAKALFDQYLEVPKDELNLQPILDAVQPDMVYFPSIGMRAWAIALANLRWAPLQIMSLGHPASSQSRHIDACLCGDRLFGGQQFFSENTLILDYGNWQPGRGPPQHATYPARAIARKRIACGCSVPRHEVELSLCGSSQRHRTTSEQAAALHFFSE
ncbi:MAG: hypothetical protein HC848_00585 [Limnobacter sp.]|nr:hypothetical protein [Limnobacter sp.]